MARGGAPAADRRDRGELDDGLGHPAARVLEDPGPERVELGGGGGRADDGALAAGAVDGLEDELVEAVHDLLAVLGLAEPPRVDARQDRLLTEVVADEVRDVGVDELVVGDAVADGVGQGDTPRAGRVTAPAELVLSVALAAPATGTGLGEAGCPITETLTVTVDGSPLPCTEVRTEAGTRLRIVSEAPVGDIEVVDEAKVRGALPAVEDAEDATALARDRVVHRLPSRYCESDTLAPTAAAAFEGPTGEALLDAVSSWAGQPARLRARILAAH